MAAAPASSKAPGTALDLARQLNEAFVEVAERVTPSVVVISVVQKRVTHAADDDAEGGLEGLPREFWRYFRRPLEPQ